MVAYQVAEIGERRPQAVAASPGSGTAIDATRESTMLRTALKCFALLGGIAMSGVLVPGDAIASGRDPVYRAQGPAPTGHLGGPARSHARDDGRGFDRHHYGHRHGPGHGYRYHQPGRHLGYGHRHRYVGPGYRPHGFVRYRTYPYYPTYRHRVVGYPAWYSWRQGGAHGHR